LVLEVLEVADAHEKATTTSPGGDFSVAAVLLFAIENEIISFDLASGVCHVREDAEVAAEVRIFEGGIGL
jgi:hypothetical protein